MRLYFTGASEGDQAQTLPSRSLGGYLSTSVVPNGSISNLFDGISQYTLLNGNKEYRGVVLTNTTQQNKNVTLHYNNLSNDPISFFKMALVALATDDCNKQYMEQIASVDHKPVNAFFIDNRGEDNSLSFQLDAGQSIGIWIERTVNKSKGVKYLSNDALNERFTTKDINQSVDITLTSNTVDKTYWTIDTQETKAYIYYTTDTVDTILEDRELIKVAITAGWTIEQIIDATISRLQQVLEFREEVEVEKLSSSSIKITHSNPGKNVPVDDQTAPITTTEILGSSKDTEDVELIELVFDYTDRT